MVGSIYKNNFNPNSIAIKYKGNCITYNELDTAVNQYASLLSKLGVKADDRVLLSCPNSPEFIYSYLSVVKNGAVIVPMNLQLTMTEIRYLLDDSGAKFMLIHPAILKAMNQSQGSLEELLNLQVFVLDEVFKQDLLEIPLVEVEAISDENAVSTFLYTSGTTGKPKAAMLTHKNLVTNAEQCRVAFSTTAEDNFMCVLPMFHVFGFTVSVLNPLWTGATVTILEKFHPKEIVESFIQDEVTVFAGVPTMYVVLLEACKNSVLFPKLRLAISGGAAMPVEVLRQAKDILKLPVVEGYGLTEASPVVSFNPLHGMQKVGSIGVPLQGIACKIVDEKDVELPAGTVGELITVGDNVMRGYYKKETETAEALKNGWLHTGDLAKKDDEGYLYIVDRKKDLIITGGLNVYPREVEEVIYQFPKVKEAAVVGVPDNLRGEMVKAFIVLKTGEECTSRELLAYLKENLAGYKLPKKIEFIPELPKNGSGKILKRMLKA
ncbi:long-chain fatty acid--CoA ligase [Proteiniclasticum sp. BAD-10]|uniref:Long-chain fatty acid--CoA ligase n=1 Tax=Proteiniclasticum sediminis TaxID=2804028 RepID=A0A941CM42_9CLOT|nr:long-chain fatty acid--CoA ligase [Proteiniclasticum sediminis]MBR0575137.1 long-chain fatty acid--CoA ligase [Proteiniclasticum sediminis]